MRVGYVVKRYPRFSETFIVNEILAHEAAGLDVELFSLRPSNDQHFQDGLARVRAPVTYLGGGSGRADDFWSRLAAASQLLPEFPASLKAAVGESSRDVAQAADLATEIVRRGITHLHAHFATSATSVARLASIFSGVPYTFTAHAKDIFHESTRVDDLTAKLRDAAATVTVSDFNVHHLCRVCGPDAKRVERIYNGLPLDRFPYVPPGDRPPVIVAVGRLVPKKGFGDLIDACGVLRSLGRVFSCRIIGSGDLESELRGRIEALRLDSVVKLLGARPQSEVIREVAGASLLVAPCVLADDGNRDGLPTVLPEAMALGTPCVATSVTGIPEIVRHRETGLLVSPGQPIELANAAELLLVSPELRVGLATGARKLVERDYDIDRNAARLRELFAAPGALRLEARS